MTTKETQSPVKRKEKEQAPVEDSPWEVTTTWIATNSRITRLQNELKDLRSKRDTLEKKYPYLGQIKGILRREAKREEDDESSEDEPEPIKKRSKKEKSKKDEMILEPELQEGKTSRERLEKKMKNLKNRVPQQAEASTPRLQDVSLPPTFEEKK
jgi:predicted RNase H-like nuclease (RuvC/YqgF family)